MTPYRPRRAGSARYSAYFKVQVWDPCTVPRRREGLP